MFSSLDSIISRDGFFLRLFSLAIISPFSLFFADSDLPLFAFITPPLSLSLMPLSFSLLPVFSFHYFH
jgi:hypothetical protein